MRFPFRTLSLLLLFPLMAAGQERSIDERLLVNAPVDSVWKVWTTTDGVRTFFAPAANVDLRVDGPYEIFFNPYADPGLRGADGMKILAYQEKRMLAFTWNAPPAFPEARKQRTHVVIRFQPQSAGGTLVTLHHDGWGTGGEWDLAFDYFKGAWPKVFGNLRQRFAIGPVDWTAWMEQLRKTER